MSDIMNRQRFLYRCTQRILLLISIATLSACDLLMPAEPPVPTVDVMLAARQTMMAAWTLTPSPTVTSLPSWTPPAVQNVVPQASSTLMPAGKPDCIPANAPMQVGLVTAIIDGDTIEAFIDGRTYQVRYIGIDAPEIGSLTKIGQFFAPEAAAKNQEMLVGGGVILVKDVTDSDAAGRLLRYVFIDSLSGVFVNYEMLRQGYAHVALTPPDMACATYLEDAERAAKMAQAGMWNPAIQPSLTPIPTITPSITPSFTWAPPTYTVTPTYLWTPGPTTTHRANCDCRGPKLSCSSFATRAQAQACYDHCKRLGLKDIFGLDPDKDGQACK